MDLEKTMQGIWLAKIYFLLVFILGLSGCVHVKLISSYDESTDKAVTQLQRDFETFFVTLESRVGLKECDYTHNVEFYQNAKVNISAIDVRARAIPQNEKTVAQVGLLRNSTYALENLHRLSCLTIAQIENIRTSINTTITAILKLELAKKRGE